MRAFDKQEAWELKPRKLTIEETERPEEVFSNLFDYATLPQLRGQLWEATKVLVTGSFHNLKIRDRNDLLFLYEQLERLIEASHVIYERNKSEKRA